MNIKTEPVLSLNGLHYLPAFAGYLLAERLDEFIQAQLKYSFELDIPLLKHFLSLPEEERNAITKQSSVEFLNYLANNKAGEQIREALTQWKANVLPGIERDAILPEDIILVNHMRKRSMLDFITDYTSDCFQLVELIKEIDFFTTESITTATNLFINLYQERIGEHSHFIQKVAETVPGAVYIYDLDERKGFYTNNKLKDLTGYDESSANLLDENSPFSIVHPDDRQLLQQQKADLQSIKDGDILLLKYRVRTTDGNYKWLANYESVFKRKNNGDVWQTIGITLDVDKEQKVVEHLHHREQQLLEAQNITKLGNYYWDYVQKKISGSKITFELLETQPENFESFIDKVHPEDRAKVQEATEAALKTGTFSCQYRLQGKQREKMIWARGVVDFKDGKPVGMTGTLMDVTDQNRLMAELAEADKRHKQAESLTHIGTYAWNLLDDTIEWSDEMYRIYEADPHQKLTVASLINSIHPADRDMLDSVIKNSIANSRSFDFYYRIITKTGKEKIIHSRGQVQNDDGGKPQKIVGTDQDVTEKQTLIRSLRKSDSLYKQAEEIANMGNWSWEIESNKLEWTDHLYSIYGLAPQEEKVTIEKFLSFIHPDDREFVEAGVDKLPAERSLDYTFRIIAKNGAEKWIRSIAQVIHNEDGKVTHVIGIEQDVTEKQKLIGKLEESQRLYKQAQELAKMGNFSWNLDTGEVFWSDEVYKIYNRPFGETIHADYLLDSITEDDKTRVQKTLDMTISGRKGHSISYAISHKNGDLKYVDMHTDVLVNKEGRVTSVIGTVQDVTDQLKTQAELKESQTFIRKITDATPSIIASYNVNTGRYTFISQGIEKLLGYTTDEVMKKGTAFFEEVVHPDDFNVLMEKNAKALEEANLHPDNNDLVAEFTYRVRHKQGGYRWFHTYGTIFDHNKEGKVEHVLNISLDITDQKQATEKIKEQEHFIQQIADASPTILYLFDVPSQSMAYINREAFFVLGYLPEEILEEGAEITERLYHSEDLELLPCRHQSKKTFQQVDSMIQYECRMKHKDGEYRWLLVREIVFKADEAGNITQIIGAALDINRRKEMEKTILQNTLQLEQSNASLEEFAYVASHDLKEPLRKISTFGDRLSTSQMNNLSEEGKMYLRKIIDASQRMQNMISDLLSISMISGNHSFECYSLQKIMEDTLQTLEFKIEQQGAVIKYDELPEAKIVPSQIRQLFQNLISNSLKFVKEGVQPVITINYAIATQEELEKYGLTKEEKYAKLVFSDNGIGFENEYAQKIFTIFHRLHGRSEYEGSGIGLAICKKIVEHHGGVIFAQGVPGEGAVFTIILPA